MTTHLKARRRLLLQAGCATSALLCGRFALACEYFSPTLRITHPWTRATPVSAPFAVLGMRFDEVTEDEQLLAVETPVAQAVVLTGAGVSLNPDAPGSSAIALPLHIPAGRETVLGADPSAFGGHSAMQQLRLLRLTQDLEVARSYPMWLTFKKGGTVKVLLNVDYARFG